MASKKKQRMSLYNLDEFTVMDLGQIEIWDGADLALIRETLTRLIDVEQCRAIGMNLEFVKYIPSGFFGMLYDLHEKGIAICLYKPQPNVANMLWFRQFFSLEDIEGEKRYMLMSEPQEEMRPEGATPWTESTVAAWEPPVTKPVTVEFKPVESN